MGKFYGYAPFSGHFWAGKRIFWRDFGRFIEFFFILLNHGVSGGGSIQMPFLKLLIAQFGAVFFYFTNNAIRLKKIDNVEAKK